MTHYPLLCPFCDEPSISTGKPYMTQQMIIHPRKCLMGHTFYSKEFVPRDKEYGYFQDTVERIIAKDKRKKEEARRRKTLASKRKYNDKNRYKYFEKKAEADKLKAEDREQNPENYTPKGYRIYKHYWVRKEAGKKEFHYIHPFSVRRQISVSMKKTLRKQKKERQEREKEERRIARLAKQQAKSK